MTKIAINSKIAKTELNELVKKNDDTKWKMCRYVAHCLSMDFFMRPIN